jgi:hypothetical protein
MKNKYKSRISTIILLTLSSMLVLYSSARAQDDDDPNAFLSNNYLYIEEFQVPTGMTPNEAIAEGQMWVKSYRATGEYKSVRLFLHNTGPSFSVYVLLEPNSWQSIETGQAKFFEAQPDFMDRPWKFALHSDNLLSEVPVE